MLKVGDKVKLKSLTTDTKYDSNWRCLSLNTEYEIDCFGKFDFISGKLEDTVAFRSCGYTGWVPLRLISYNQELEYEIC